MTNTVKVVLHYSNEQEKFALINKANELGYSWTQSEGLLSKISVITPDENSAYISLVKAKQHATK